MPGLDGKTVVLTGASQGIGVVIAHALAREGAQLVLAARSGDKLASVAEKLGRGALTVPCDITVASERQVLVARALEHLGRVDILVNNAGVEEIREYVQQDPGIITRIIDTNFAAPLQLTRAFLPHMLAQGYGRIVNIASLAGRIGLPYGCVYAGSKGGLAEWSISLDAELAGTGVKVSVVCPGFVANTGMFARKQRKAPGTLGVSAPEDVARAVLMAIQARKPELIVNPRPVRPLMVLKALSPGMAVNVARRLGLIKFLRSLASK